MIKAVNVTFNFDTESNEVTNVKCVVDGMVKKTRSTKKKSEVEEEMASEALLTLEPTKLVLNNKLVSDMGIVYGDRVVIKFEQQGDKKKKVMIPVISKEDGDEGSGNKITKTNTVAYKGKQNAVLAEFGSEFTIEPYKEGIWKLVSKTGGTAKTLTEVTDEVENVEPELIVDGDENVEIDEMQFTL